MVVPFFAEVLQAGRSLIVVRTDSQATAKVAAGILDRMGISQRWRMSMKMQAASRQIGDISVVDVRERITVGEGNIMLREVVAGLIEKGNKQILLNLQGVEYVDSAGLGELVDDAYDATEGRRAAQDGKRQSKSAGAAEGNEPAQGLRRSRGRVRRSSIVWAVGCGSHQMRESRRKWRG